MRVYDFKDYKQFVLETLQQMPRRGHGQLSRIAEVIGVHTTMVTHIFKGESNLNIEQALKLVEYFGLNERETEYFLSLVHLARAGDVQTKTYFKKIIKKQQEQALNLADRLEAKNALSPLEESVFYSQWYYSAVRLMTSIKDTQEAHSIADSLGIKVELVHKILNFLLENGLCVSEKTKTVYSPLQTFVSRESNYLSQHHRNWRIKLLEKIDLIETDELVFTNPIVISEKDFQQIREELVRLIERFQQIAGPSPSEKLCCLTIDWRKISKN